MVTPHPCTLRTWEVQPLASMSPSPECSSKQILFFFKWCKWFCGFQIIWEISLRSSFRPPPCTRSLKATLQINKQSSDLWQGNLTNPLTPGREQEPEPQSAKDFLQSLMTSKQAVLAVWRSVSAVLRWWSHSTSAPRFAC